jgi:hypothetical protein
MFITLRNYRRPGKSWGLILLAILLSSCGGGGSSGNVNLGDPPPTQITLSLAVPESIYGDVMIDCIEADTKSESCKLDTLPMLAAQISDPSIDDIIARTVISHDWMAIRFRQYLESAPAEILPLFRAVTAVVIAADIRPSQYSPITGAIYIDPGFLWTTNAEKATVLTAPDFRAEFGSELMFVPLSRYVDGTDYAWEFFSLSDNQTRIISDLEMPLTGLMFHELAHANDFFPPDKIDSLDTTLSVWDATNSIARFRVSSRVYAAQPLNSQVWKGLAGVLYGGDAATAGQQALTAQQVGAELEIDGANDSYSYTSIYEDVAMLFEEVMMAHVYGIDREVAFTDVPPEGEEAFCDSYIVRWGYRDRVGDPLVHSRAEQVLQLLLDQTDVSAYTANLDSPRVMSNGEDWCTVQLLNASCGTTNCISQTQSAGVASRQRMRPNSTLHYQ